MNFIDTDRLHAITPRAFQSAHPYPWVNPHGFLTQPAFNTLLAKLPDLELFEARLGGQRDFGQKGHDRYSLEYAEDLDIAPEWHQFVSELRGNEYTRWVKELLNAWAVRLSFHWHYTPRGCSVSPHCDSRGKLGSQIFYFNTEDSWKPEWGGETLILDDRKKFTSRSAHEFHEFYQQTPAKTLNNHSLIFKRTEHAWHGVKELHCPEGELRKVFIVVYERVRPIKDLRKRLRARLTA